MSDSVNRDLGQTLALGGSAPCTLSQMAAYKEHQSFDKKYSASQAKQENKSETGITRNHGLHYGSNKHLSILHIQ